MYDCVASCAEEHFHGPEVNLPRVREQMQLVDNEATRTDLVSKVQDRHRSFALCLFVLAGATDMANGNNFARVAMAQNPVLLQSFFGTPRSRHLTSSVSAKQGDKEAASLADRPRGS